MLTIVAHVYIHCMHIYIYKLTLHMYALHANKYIYAYNAIHTLKYRPICICACMHYAYT